MIEGNGVTYGQSGWLGQEWTIVVGYQQEGLGATTIRRVWNHAFSRTNRKWCRLVVQTASDSHFTVWWPWTWSCGGVHDIPFANRLIELPGKKQQFRGHFLVLSGLARRSVVQATKQTARLKIMALFKTFRAFITSKFAIMKKSAGRHWINTGASEGT